jgi:hypothetical protein
MTSKGSAELIAQGKYVVHSGMIMDLSAACTRGVSSLSIRGA